MRIKLTNVFVEDQAKALAFYTEVLGFVVKHNIPVGEFLWLTVISPNEPDGAELLLEPAEHRAVGPYKAALFEDGIPAAQFDVDDVEAEHKRLSELGVRFTQEPMDVGQALIAVLDDTCGNLVQLIQYK